MVGRNRYRRNDRQLIQESPGWWRWWWVTTLFLRQRRFLTEEGRPKGMSSTWDIMRWTWPRCLDGNLNFTIDDGRHKIILLLFSLYDSVTPVQDCNSHRNEARLLDTITISSTAATIWCNPRKSQHEDLFECDDIQVFDMYLDCLKQPWWMRGNDRVTKDPRRNCVQSQSGIPLEATARIPFLACVLCPTSWNVSIFWLWLR